MSVALFIHPKNGRIPTFYLYPDHQAAVDSATAWWGEHTPDSALPIWWQKSLAHSIHRLDAGCSQIQILPLPATMNADDARRN